MAMILYNVMYLEHDMATGDSWVGYIMGIDQYGGYDFMDYKGLVKNHKTPKAYDLKTALAIVERIKDQGEYAVIAPAILPMASGSPEFVVM